MEKTPMEIIAILPPCELEKAERFIRLGEQLAHKSQVRFAKAHKTWKCAFSKRTPSRVLFTVECTESWWQIKAILSHLEQYQDVLADCSETLIDLIKTAFNCHQCNPSCKGANPFTLEGVTYRECIGCSFYFRDLSDADWNSLFRLIQKEASFTLATI